MRVLPRLCGYQPKGAGMIHHPTYLVVSVAAYVVVYAYLWIDGRRDRG